MQSLQCFNDHFHPQFVEALFWMIDVIKLSTTMQHAPSRHEFTSVEHMFTNNTWSGILYRCWKLIVVFNPWKYFQFLKGGVHTAGQYSHPTNCLVVVDPLHWPTKQQNQRRQTRLITWAVISTLSPLAKLPVLLPVSYCYEKWKCPSIVGTLI